MGESVKDIIINKFNEGFYESLLIIHNDEAFWDKLYKVYKKKKNFEEFFLNEIEIISIFLKAFKEKFSEYYSIIEPRGIGGSGLIIKVFNKKLKIHRALKFPRPQKSKKDNKFLIESLKTEMKILTTIIHENIISIYDLGELKISPILKRFPELEQFPYYIMGYIKGGIDLREYIENKVSSEELEGLTKEIALIFFKISNAIALLHKKQLLHFDIKPENILIQDGNPFLCDLGFAKKKTIEKEHTVIGFTLYYAHPDLKQGLRQGKSLSRIKKKMAPADFKFKHDIYALGKTFLEILSVISKKLSLMEYDYNFAYLHLLACRMLDGKNLNENDYKIEEKRGFPVYKEYWVDLDENDFTCLKYEEKIGEKIIEQIKIDLEKLIYRDLYLKEIPELSDNYPNRIRSSLYCSAPFSLRVKHIVEHPVFSRLAEEHQITLSDTIYPTATHTRLEHSIGAFNNCCLYVQSLYNDPYNPLFKQLININEIKILILASLFHDLGQYPFAHLFEELGLFKSQLNHNKITLDFLENPAEDNNGKTLQEYLKDEWDADLEEIKKLLSRAEISNEKRDRNLKLDLLSSIINGIIDIDKLDYYQRDTHNCNLSYGLMIDSPRLIRNLTVIIIEDGNSNNTFTIGVYRRAQAAAETLAFTRYLLYQSVYWHHTARAFISMLKTVLISLTNSSKDFIEDFEDFLGVKENPKRVNALQVLKFIKKFILGEDHNDKKNLLKIIDMIIRRNYYKRIFTIKSEKEDSQISGSEIFLEEYRRKKTDDSFQKNLREQIRAKFKEKNQTYVNKKIIKEEQIKKTLTILNHQSSLICDYVDPKLGIESKNQTLKIIPEPKYSYKNIKYHNSEVFKQVYGKLINIVSKGRIFCHPEIRDTLMQVLTLNDINDCIKDALKEIT